MVGYLNKGVTITDSYTVSKVSKKYNSSYDIGGLIGKMEEGAVVTNCYWSPDLAEIETNAGGTACTLDQMKQRTSYEGWDFDEVWIMKDYPELRF